MPAARISPITANFILSRCCVGKGICSLLAMSGMFSHLSTKTLLVLLIFFWATSTGLFIHLFENLDQIFAVRVEYSVATF